MADSYNKKEREKKRQKRKKEKQQRKEERKLEGKKTQEFMYLDEDGNLTSTPPDQTRKKKEISIEEIQISTPKKEESDRPKFMREGIVKFFNTEKGYGFIADKETRESFFVHIDGLVDEIKENDKVSFEVGKGPKGPIALAVKKI
jgi:cold shock CspA family protein